MRCASHDAATSSPVRLSSKVRYARLRRNELVSLNPTSNPISVTESLFEHSKTEGKATMSKTHGKFVWYDVMTSNPKTAESFYRSVIGWDAKDSGMTDGSYTILSMGPTMVGGLMPIPEDAARAGVGPAWMGYVAVDDVGIYAKRVKAAGRGAPLRAPRTPAARRASRAGAPHRPALLLF